MMEGSHDIAISSPFSFRGADYIVGLECHNNKMNVQVEDRETGDQWQASFEAQYIEDLTHKTGNFKQFNIFANMLESAISKSSESVTLDLLTYADLESLRQKKSGVSYQAIKSSNTASRAPHLTAKRYLILTYTVEFDRIHYPLPLPYAGKSDPVAVQEEVVMLRAEVQRLKAISLGDVRGDKLMREIHKLEKDKAQIEEEYAMFRREVKATANGNAAKDIRVLKVAVRNLEDQLMKEKTRHQRSTNKRSQEYRELLDEVEELRASERNLKVRLKSLTNELALYKRGRTLTRTNSKERTGSGDRLSATRNPSSRQRSLSSERLHTGRSGSGSRTRLGSKERQPYIPRSNSSEQLSRGSLNGSRTRARSNSYDRSTSANRSRLSTGSGGNRSRTPSPAGARRFNPTAYIKEKERRQHESTLKKKREQRSNASGVSRTSANSSRNSGYSNSNRLPSRENSISSYNGNMSDGYNSDGSYTSQQRSSGPRGWSRNNNAIKRPTLPPNGKTSKQLASTPDTSQPRTMARTRQRPPGDSGDDGDSDGFDRSAEISEIDERLDRLQQLMKATMP